jgi:integrase
LLRKAAEKAEKAARERGDLDYRFRVEASLYDLRHTAMENLKAAAVPLDVFHVLCGHSSTATSLKHYNKPSLKRRRAAATAVSEWIAREAAITG